MRHIVVATDGSADANRAVDVAAELAKAFGGKLFIVTIAGNLSGEETQKLAGMEENVGSALEALSMQIVTKAKRAHNTLVSRTFSFTSTGGMPHVRLSKSPRWKPPTRLCLAGAAGAA